MRQKSGSRARSSERVVKDIRRATRKRHSAEEKIRIVLDGLRGEDSIAEGEGPSLDRRAVDAPAPTFLGVTLHARSDCLEARPGLVGVAVLLPQLLKDLRREAHTELF